MSLIEDNISLNDDTFPHRLASLIKGLDLSQADICKKTGISKQALHHYLSGTRIPRADTLLALSKLLNVSVEYLLTGENDQSKIDTKGLTDAQIQKVNEYASLFRISNAVKKELPISMADVFLTCAENSLGNIDNISNINSLNKNNRFDNIKDFINCNKLFLIHGDGGTGKSNTIALLLRNLKSTNSLADSLTRCPNCKHLIFSNYAFCPDCGKKIVE